MTAKIWKHNISLTILAMRSDTAPVNVYQELIDALCLLSFGHHQSAVFHSTTGHSRLRKLHWYPSSHHNLERKMNIIETTLTVVKKID